MWEIEALSTVCWTNTAKSLPKDSSFPKCRQCDSSFAAIQPALIALEAGGHSRWMSELLRELGHEVIVADPHRQQPQER
jgi:transposase